MACPRVLWLGNDDRTLHLAPAPELERLRHDPREVRRPDPWTTAARPLLSGINGESMRDRPAHRAWHGTAGRPAGAYQPGRIGDHPPLLRRGGPKPPVRRYPQRQQGPAPVVEQAPLALASGEALELRVFIDRSVRRSVRQRPARRSPGACSPRAMPQRPGSAVVPRWTGHLQAPYEAGR